MKNNSKIAVIGAMDCEVENLKNLLTDVEEEDTSNLNIFIGKLHDKQVFLAKSGVGKVNAALNTQYIIDTYHPDIIINTGVAGGIAPELSIGDVVVGEKLVQHDFDASVLGYAKGYMCNGVNPDRPTLFYSDNDLIEIFIKNAHDYKVHKGMIATGDMFVSSKTKKLEIYNEFGATAVEMEGCAVAQCATANKLPFIVIRAISDLADGSAISSQNDFEKLISSVSSSAVEILIKNL